MKEENEELKVGQDFVESREEAPETGIKNYEIAERLSEKPITLIDHEFKLTVENLQDLGKGQKVLLCDGYVKEMETARRLGPSFIRENVMSLDHHLPLEEFSRQISTTNLAIEFVREFGPIAKEVNTVITHTDCDSILSSAIMRGIIEPLDEYGIAAIAADHTGAENEIADLLQSMNVSRDIELSLRNLELLQAGQPLEPRVDKLLKKRHEERERAKEIVENEFQQSPSGKIYFTEIEKHIDAGLLPAITPDASIIVLFSPLYEKETHNKLPQVEAKVRLGMAAPAGTDLRKIMAEVDPNWGGRWNAGSNKRNGGTEMSTEEYIAKLELAVGKILPDSKPDNLEMHPELTEEKFESTRKMIEELTKKIETNFDEGERANILDAINLTICLHKDQQDRPDGQPYLNHILEVTQNVFSITDNPKADVVIAALLHDSVEDQAAKLNTEKNPDERSGALEEVAKRYGDNVASIIDHLSNPDFEELLKQKGIMPEDPDFQSLKNHLYSEHVREVISDIDVMIVKLADFMNNAFHLDRIPAENQSKIKKLALKYIEPCQVFIERLNRLNEDDFTINTENLIQQFRQKIGELKTMGY